MREQRLGLRGAVAGAQDDQLDGVPRRAKRRHERLGGDEQGAAIRGLEEHAALAAVTAEVDHDRPDLAQRAEQIERLHRPPRLELEAVPVTAALQLGPDRARFSVEGASIDPAGVGGQEQDGVLLHQRGADPVATRAILSLARGAGAWLLDEATAHTSSRRRLHPRGAPVRRARAARPREVSGLEA
jgi:hypothetical protein